MCTEHCMLLAAAAAAAGAAVKPGDDVAATLANTNTSVLINQHLLPVPPTICHPDAPHHHRYALIALCCGMMKADDPSLQQLPMAKSHSKGLLAPEEPEAAALPGAHQE